MSDIGKDESGSPPAVQIRTARDGIVWWGLPVAIVTTVWIHGKRYGFDLSTFVSVEFVVLLAVNLLWIGVGGGLIFGRMFLNKTKGG